jgi:hypothetical protein
MERGSINRVVEKTKIDMHMEYEDMEINVLFQDKIMTFLLL